MVAEDDDPWSAKRSGFQRSRSLDVTMMDTLSKYGGGSQSGYVHHYVLRVLKTCLWDPRCQTYVFESRIA